MNQGASLPSPAETLVLIIALEELGFTDSMFKRLHHFGEGASLEGHKNYLSGINSYKPGGKNLLLHKRLELLAERLKGGAEPTFDLTDGPLPENMEWSEGNEPSEGASGGTPDERPEPMSVREALMNPDFIRMGVEQAQREEEGYQPESAKGRNRTGKK